MPAGTEDVDYDARTRSTSSTPLTDGYPYFVQAYGKVTWDVAPRPARSPVADVAAAAPEAEAELAVGFFGARYDRATPAEREYMRAMADLAAAPRRRRGHAPPTSRRRSAASRRASRRPATG